MVLLKIKTSEIFTSAKNLFYLVICFVFLNNSILFAQPEHDLNDKDYKAGILQKVDSLIETKYVIPKLAKNFAEEFKTSYDLGTFNSIIDPKIFASQVTTELIRITKDKHISFRIIESSDIGEKATSSLRHPLRYHLLGIKENKGFSKIEWLDGNIGYADIRRFYLISDIRDMVESVIKFMAHANAIIIDIRENGGGSGDYLSNYFLKHPTQLTSWYSRGDDFTTEFWTNEQINVKRLTEVPLYILTSERTFSAAESFAYDMKVQKRAVIIGDSTKGGAHSVDLFKIDDQFEIYIPTARAINHITGVNWEGTGVIPDILVPAEATLDTAIVLARKAGEKYAEKAEAELSSATKKMEMYMDRAELLFRENKTSDASIALDSVFLVAENQNLINEFFIYVLAYNYLSPQDEEILYAILKKKIEYFPKSYTAYETLADAYAMNNKRELAILNYKKVLELDPGNRNAIKMIKKLHED